MLSARTIRAVAGRALSCGLIRALPRAARVVSITMVFHDMWEADKPILDGDVCCNMMLIFSPLFLWLHWLNVDFWWVLTPVSILFFLFFQTRLPFTCFLQTKFLYVLSISWWICLTNISFCFSKATPFVRNYASSKAAPTEVSSILESKIRGVSQEANLDETGKVLAVG